MMTKLAVLLAGLLAATGAGSPAISSAADWRLVVDDRFEDGSVPAHWSRYDGPYGSGAENCARPDHAFVRGGTLRLVLRHRARGDCGPGWYSAGMMLAKRYRSVDQKIALRFRVVSKDGVRAHRILPMRWPSSDVWPDDGEEDYCEGSRLHRCSTFLHSDEEREHHEYRFDQTRWHTLTFVRRDFTVRAYVDGHRRWTYRGDESTLPATLKRPVLQQECRSRCPDGTRGRETIEVEWIKVWNPK